MKYICPTEWRGRITESCCKARTFILEMSHVHKGQDDRKDQAHNSKNAEEARPLEDDRCSPFSGLQNIAVHGYTQG